ncbi:MAG: ABC transporter permease [Flavobacteriales bacterium]|jgi:lipoprotein-releasing system permease protein|nr:ABC transporter permease [Flavobacteriales bacterium]
MLENKKGKEKVSKPIVFLAIAGITLGIAVMLLSISIASGFQKEVREKIIGFGSHVQISSSYNNLSFESSPLLIDDIAMDAIKADESVNHVQVFAYKPAIMQAKEVLEKNEKGEAIRDILGVVFKGVSHDFNNTFFQKHLKEGKIPNFQNRGENDSIVVSRFIADKLQLAINDKVATFFVKQEGPKQRNLIVAGIYETGLEDFDRQFCFIDLNQVRKLNEWGIATFLKVEENCEHGFVVVSAKVFGGNQNYRYSWNNAPYSVEQKQILCPIKDTVIQLVATDFESNGYLEPIEQKSIADTAWLTIKTQGNNQCNCESSTADLEPNYLNDSVTAYRTQGGTFITTLKTSGGSANHYSGGVEVLLNKFEKLEEGEEIIERYVGPQYNVTTIVTQNEEIFNWLEMLDMNVYIIIGLMIIVAIINMTSALMVLILEKTQMIGILKALGATNWSVRKVFIYNGAYLILKGMLYGNILAFLVIFLQQQFHIITLPQENYYVSVVPMDIPVFALLLVNLGAFVVCYLALVLPSFIVTKITPVKAIKFD